MRAADQQLSFHALEFLHQQIHFDPAPKAVSDFLDQHAEAGEMGANIVGTSPVAASPAKSSGARIGWSR